MNPHVHASASPWPGATSPPGPAPVDLSSMAGDQVQALIRLLEAAPAVQRRHQFFVWIQSQMQPLVPHQMLVCGAWQRQRRTVVLDAFHNVVLPQAAIEPLTDPAGPLVAALQAQWIAGRGRARLIDLDRLDAAARLAVGPLRAALGDTHLLVHGVARPQRPAEIESLFIFGGLAASQSGPQMDLRGAWLDLVLPFLHSTWLRVTSTELDLQRPAGPSPAASAGHAEPQPRPGPPVPPRGGVTERERQILAWVQEGKSNHQIATVLGISPLTVKNHVQKILRKLGASNRAQAVSRALALGVLASGSTEPPDAGP
ncbi:LuxR C-terminal-related transcriptional regulator [Ideonella sp. DXS22W]|uniref:LuxR C-terminal-related transcriptional regulator n=1 Tax=Pseudaquabacterium inlustre TaxID=2984192 RepID=A0ABU9CI33_9BURK